MILQALKEYYDRKAALPESDVAPPGWQWKEIPLVVVLNREGIPVSVFETYEGEGKSRKAKRYLAPQAVKRTRAVLANLLWDNPEYVLGMEDGKLSESAKEKHRTFRERMNGLTGIQDEGLDAVKLFLDNPKSMERLLALGDSIEKMVAPGPNTTFQLIGDVFPVFSRPLVKRAIEALLGGREREGETAICLVTGERRVPARLHDAIKGVWGAQSSGGNIVSFNLDAFCSYHKEQGMNASVSASAMTSYTKALNLMLEKGSRSRIQVGDASTVFWAERDGEFVDQFADFFGEPSKDDPDSGVRAVEALFKSVDSGALSALDNSGGRFYVLGLAPNASRISIRFWIIETVAVMAGRIAAHFRDLSIVHGPRERTVLSMFRLLVSIAPLGKSENISPKLAGEVMRSALQGLPYPQTLLQSALRRIKAEHEVSYPRAALIKASINRKTRTMNPNIEEELKMSLDETNRNVGYRLGRLFATLEKIQEEANPGINATIRDRFYGAASGTPVTVFGNLMRLKNHHLAKLDSPGRRIYFEKLIGSILEGVEAQTAFPPHLSLDDQGRFAVGYYHQTQAFYTKKSEPKETNA